LFNVTIVALMINLAATWRNQKSGLGDRPMLRRPGSWSAGNGHWVTGNVGFSVGAATVK
jgi:hypothetical protein